MERSLWKNQELNRLELFARKQNIPENTKNYIEQLIIRASKYCGTFDDAVINAPILFGLKHQGLIPMVEKMIKDGATWDEIGKKIGWDPKTAEEHYGWYVDSINVGTDDRTPQH